MKKYIAVHSYKYGDEIYGFSSVSSLEELNTFDNNLAKQLGIDYNDETESLTVFESPTEFPPLK